ncbi:hypothetical protein, partial [Pseudomonas syringae]
SLVRELPGTGSKPGAYGLSGTTGLNCLRAASQPIAAVVRLLKLLQPFGQKPNQWVFQDLCITRRGIS